MTEGWRPMENVPMDGTKVDLWYCGQRIPDCWWSPYERAWSSDCSFVGLIRERDPQGWIPAHPQPTREWLDEQEA